MPRVIAGCARGRRLKAPPGERTRPTSDRTKEAMFSALEARLEWAGLRVLDLFAGSGQLGIEALSRGAAKCTFIEQQRRTAGIIHDNLAICNLTEYGTVIAKNVASGLRQLEADQCPPFDLILLDPPYREVSEQWPKTYALLKKCHLLKPGAMLVMEHGDDFETMAFVTDLKLLKRCKYGTAMLSFCLYTPILGQGDDS
ncbi:MAG TPA: 16S rRNA (guanine(966)-N(2))-methyltransferase RsmD [Clostridiaceae bacterium]|nr:16S rRNA (guanine(966)-N(2))-methyltransferase RsmD [Clostridiaceae bacterium]